MARSLRGRFFLALLIFGAAAACSSAARQAPDAPPLPPAPPVQAAAPEPEPEPEEDTEGLLQRISGCLEQRDFMRAIALFDEIEPEDAASSSIQILKASVLSSAGMYRESRDLVNRIIELEPGNLEALFVRAALDGIEGREKDQQSTLEGIIKEDPAHAGALTELGNIAARNRSFRNAAAYFDRALAASPNYGDALVGRAAVHRHSKELQKAETLLNQAIRLYPQWAAPYSERARLYRGAGYPADALKDLDIARRLEPDNYWISYDRGSVLLDLYRRKDALEEFNHAVSLDPENFLAYVYTAGLKDDMGDPDGAERDYERLARLNPDYYFAFEGLGLHRMRKQRWAEARDAFKTAYTKAPDETYYALLAAFNLLKAGGKQTEVKQLLEPVMRKVKRESIEWYLVRLYYDQMGEADIAQRIDREQNPETKARMLFYLALYYETKNSVVLSNRYFLQLHEMGQRAFLEWRYGEWIVAERKLAGR